MNLPPSVERALQCQPQAQTVRIDGTDVRFLTWNSQDSAKPALLFAHGYRGHAHWWCPIAPFFTDRFRVYAPHFSGMGDSGWRTHYTHETFTRDLLEVMTHAGLTTARLVGHSFGGSAVLRAAVAAPKRVEHAIVIDTLIRFPDTDQEPAALRFGRSGPAPDYASIRARYRLLPEQPVVHPELLEFVAHHSIRAVAGGWSWKFDPRLPFAPGAMLSGAVLPTVGVPTDYIYGDLSAIVDAARAQRIAANLQRTRAPVAIPDAHHHIMLDQPLALVTALHALLA
jgi:pimeloyl-ACP methyl ester carboxylesterase